MLTMNHLRYTLTYTPSNDRILPSPKTLHLKIKNTSAIPLRAAYLHGPYSLHVSAYPSTFNPNQQFTESDRYGVPQFEPLLKAGGHWSCKLVVPEDIRETGADFASGYAGRNKGQGSDEKEVKSATWIIEIASQVLFSQSAAVHFEVLIGRDERSLELGFAAVASHGHGGPGQVHDHQKDRKRDHGPAKGVYSKAVRLVVEDTEALWDKPKLPSANANTSHKKFEDGGPGGSKPDDGEKTQAKDKVPQAKKKKLHLVVLTHGLHSNLGADMLYLKESIDATVRQARLDARKRKASYSAKRAEATQNSTDSNGTGTANDDEQTAPAPISGGQEDLNEQGDDSTDEDEEEVIVRGFSGNAVRTEKGIQYLGKRLAKFVLRFTYPDQPFMPVKKSVSQRMTDKLSSSDKKDARDGPASHNGSSIHHEKSKSDALAYTFTSISFIGHSLGGLTQTYAIAYIQKHAPEFFKQIKPVNFICMASPLLGLSNENPMYVKFALDFGLVGRTGQDLGLTWRTPTIAKHGWTAMVGGLGGGQKDQLQPDPGSKPLLRILPTGPAHQVLHLFRNRTVYSNVVNDGIVPLRTSCLLFLDWKGLGKVEKARREGGLIGTMAEWGWAEITGQNSFVSSAGLANLGKRPTQSGTESPNMPQGEGETVPQPSANATQEDNKTSGTKDPDASQFLDADRSSARTSIDGQGESRAAQSTSMFDDFLNFFRPNSSGKPTHKTTKAISRGQTLSKEQEEALAGQRPALSRIQSDDPMMRPASKRPMATRGDSTVQHLANVQAPPKTSVFEAASDILHPPIPSTTWLIDPSSRKRTIFHDRVYHPEDIPPPPTRRPGRLARSFSSDSASIRSRDSEGSIDLGAMKVEEKIARAYHRDLAWRKVLVSLEPDAHNNMIVRRMFANAYGWPVVKHLCDTHFADTYTARTDDDNEVAVDRAQQVGDRVPATGEEVRGQTAKTAPQHERSASEVHETRDSVPGLEQSRNEICKLSSGPGPTRSERMGSVTWDDQYFSGTDEDEDDDDEDADGHGKGYKGMVRRFLNHKGDAQHSPPDDASSSSQPAHRPARLSEGHRGLQPTGSLAEGRASLEGNRQRVSVGDTNGGSAGGLTEEPRQMSTSGAVDDGSADKVDK